MSVFLDLDGTLTDPRTGLVGSIVHTLEVLSLPVPEDLNWAIGPPLIETFATLGAPDPDAALEIYRARYRDGGLFEAEVYARIPEALLTLSARAPLYLATAKPHVYATRITAAFGLDQYLAGQFGPELDGTRNDKAELLAYACGALDLNPMGCVMVGDRGLDLKAARRNGMAFVGVNWGYAREGELVGADAVCAHPSELPDAVATVRRTKIRAK